MQTAPGPALYHSFIDLPEVQASPTRIFDPFSYKVTLSERFIPVSPNEAFHLAAYYPIIWHYNHVGHLELAAMRCLSADREEIPNVRAMPYDALPLLLQAYPLRYRNHSMGDFTLGLERVFPQHERNAGAYVFDKMGDFGLGAQMKYSALEQFRQGLELQYNLGEALIERNLLEKVKLPDDMESRFSLPDFYAVRADADWTGVLDTLDDTEWPAASRLLTIQRISLFRAARLVAAEEQQP
jgi:hypothetical protein